MKTISLIKAVFSEDMSLFKVSLKKNTSKTFKTLFPIIMFFIVAFAIGSYAYMIGEALHPFNLTYIMISIFIMFVTIMTFIEGIYKSQGILFSAKDDDLLFSLPIKKSQILFVRILKLLVFQFMYNLMFLLPAFVLYIYFEKPGISFYLLSILMSVLIPIIPTVVSAIIGYIVKIVSSRFKSKKIIEMFFSLVIFLGIFFLSFSIEAFIMNLGETATNINDILIKIYYPIGLYNNLITNFNMVDLVKLLVINIVPLILFIVIGSKVYFKIIFKSKETFVKKKTNNKKEMYIKRNKLTRLVIKEIKRYFSSSIYMFNTSFGLILSVVVAIIFCFNSEIEGTLEVLNGAGIKLSIPVIIYIFILFVATLTEITASSISLEGKTINITKSLPISSKLILKSKILTSFIIELPFLLVADLIFIIKFRLSLLEILLIIILTFVSVFLVAVIGLITNLKYPKMDARNDTEIVKQSMSAMISTFIGMGISMGSMLLIMYLNKYLDINLVLFLHLLVLTIISIIGYTYLMKKGSIEYIKINV